MKKIKQLVMFASMSALSSVLIINGHLVEAKAAESNVQTTTTEKVTLNKSNAAATNVDQCISRINEGNESISDYTKLKISNVKNDNIEIIRREIKKFKDSKGSDLTKDEIEYVVQDTINQIKLILLDIEEEAGEVEEYHYIGLDEVNDDNVDDINEYMAEKGYSSIKNISVGVSEILTTLSNVNNGDTSEADFANLDIYTVNSSNLDFVKKCLNEEKESKGSNLNKNEIKNCVNSNLEKLQMALAHINLGQASLEEYKFIGAEEVNDIYLDDVNHWLRNKGKNTITGVLTEMKNVINPLNKINNGEAEIEDYEFFTAELDSEVTDENINEVNEGILQAKEEKGNNLNGSEIIKTIDEIVKLINFYNYIDYDSISSSDYDDVGIENIEENDVKALSNILKDRECRTLKALKDRVDSIYEIVAKINNGEESYEDYNILGVHLVNSSNISKVKEGIAKEKTNKGRDLNLGEIIECASNTAQYEESANNVVSGNGTVFDFLYIHIEGVTDRNVKFVNSQIKISINITIENIHNTMKPILEITKVYDRVIIGNGSLEDYIKLKIDGVTSDNLIYVNADIRNGVYPTVDDINKRIKVAEVNIPLIKKISEGNADIDDYFDLNVDVIYDDILPFVNADMAYHKYLSQDEIINRINRMLSAYEALLNINDYGASINDYINLGLSNITPDILPFVNYDLYNMKFTLIDDVINRVNSRINIYKALLNIKMGAAKIEDFSVLNITGISDDILKFVNADFKGMSYLTVDEIKVKIEAKIPTYKLLYKVTTGNGSVDDFRSLGLNIVIDYNIHYLNMRIKNINILTLDDLKKMVNEIITNMRVSEVTGVLKDKETGLAINGAVIRIRIGENVKSGDYFTKNGVYISVITDSNGRYSFILPVDIYTIEIEKRGYKTTYKDVESDDFKEPENQNVEMEKVKYKASGTVTDAATGSPIKDAVIKFRVGKDIKTGEYYSLNGNVVTAKTDENGRFNIEIPEGDYTAEISADEYITDFKNIVAAEENKESTYTFSLTKAIAENQYRFRIEWHGVTKDLDTHLLGKTTSGKNVHVYYSERSLEVNDENIITLDRDDRNGTGPETLTLLKDSGEYEYDIYDYTNRSNTSSTALVGATPIITVYQGEKIVKTYEIKNNKVITTDYLNGIEVSKKETDMGTRGNLWKVCKIKNGNIIDVNTLTSDTHFDD